MRHFKIGRGRKVRRQRGQVRPTTIVVVVAVARHGLWQHTNHNLHTNERVKRSNFKVCAEEMMNNQLHGVVLMVLLFDVLVSLWFFLESSRQWWSDGAGCSLRRSYVGQVLLCGDNWWQWPVPLAQNPSFVTIGSQKTVLLCNIQYYCSNVQPRPTETWGWQQLWNALTQHKKDWVQDNNVGVDAWHPQKG